MGDFFHDARERQVIVIQTKGGERGDLKKFAEAIDGKTIGNVTIGDHPDDAGKIQSPRKVVMFNYR